MFSFSNNAKDKMQSLREKCPGTVSTDSHAWGMSRDEPLTVMMDCLFQYAKAYEVRFESFLADDHVLGPSWLKAAVGVRELLNGDGASAMLVGRSTDSKDNGSVEAMFWDAMAIAGFKEEDI